MSDDQSRNPGLPAHDGSTDPRPWFKDVTGDDALEWVREHSAYAEQELDADGKATAPAAESKTILDSLASIPNVVCRGDQLYNFRTDAEHPRGLWRCTSMDSYRTEEPDWEVLVDADTLNATEQEDWVWHGATALRLEDGQPWRHVLVALPHGGSDVDVTRGFDLVTKRFVPAFESGFEWSAAKGSPNWIDPDTMLVATDSGPESVSDSGYPLQVRRWHRGMPMPEAGLVYQGEPTNMQVGAGRDHVPDFVHDWVYRIRGFYDYDPFLLNPDDSLSPIDVPSDCTVASHRDLLLLMPRTDWGVDNVLVPAESLAVARLESFLSGWEGKGSRARVLFAPSESTSIADFFVTRDFIVTTVQEDVRTYLLVFHHDGEQRQPCRICRDLPGTVRASAANDVEGDELWITATGFLQPSTLYLGDSAPLLEGGDPPSLARMKAEPSHSDVTGFEMSQHFAISDDGTRVLYSQIGRTDLPPTGENPTLLGGYSGSEVSAPSQYGPMTGKVRLERGGTHVAANIRGGGEYGPAWHQAALEEHRHRTYEDFTAVVRDLVARGVTARERLACLDGSNGGLLTGNMFTQYSDLFGTVVIQAPLLDMRRYTKLLAGASWIAEYGDPDTDDWDYVHTFSPYHLLEESADYPVTLVTTSTRDDRTHPGHARKFMAALGAIDADIRYWENMEGGHGGVVDNAQRAWTSALIWTFLHRTISR